MHECVGCLRGQSGLSPAGDHRRLRKTCFRDKEAAAGGGVFTNSHPSLVAAAVRGIIPGHI